MAVTFPEQFPGTPIPSSVFNNVATSVSYHDGWIEAVNAEWSPYTPIWKSTSGTDPSIGNGTLKGIYAVVGSTIFYRISMTAGSSTTFGSDIWYFEPPLGLDFRGDVIEPLGNGATGWWRATDGGATYVGIVLTYADQIRMAVGLGPVGGVGGTNPFTWGSGDTMSVTGFAPLDV